MEGPGVWQFRWSEKDLHGSRVQRKRLLGMVERYPNETAARSAIPVLLAEVNWDVSMDSRAIGLDEPNTTSSNVGLHGGVSPMLIGCLAVREKTGAPPH